MNLLDYISAALLTVGIFFFFSGIVALWRFPDTLCRLHTITKADNLGLGCILFAIALQGGWNILLLKLAILYFLVLYASALNGYLIARYTFHQENDGYWRSK